LVVVHMRGQNLGYVSHVTVTGLQVAHIVDELVHDDDKSENELQVLVTPREKTHGRTMRSSLIPLLQRGRFTFSMSLLSSLTRHHCHSGTCRLDNLSSTRRACTCLRQLALRTMVSATYQW